MENTLRVRTGLQPLYVNFLAYSTKIHWLICTQKDHQRYEPSSYGLLVAQQEHQKLREEIKAEFFKDEAKKFYKVLTNGYKKTARHEARLDLEDDNRRELLKVKRKIKAEFFKDEAKKFYKVLTNGYKKTARHEARLDLEDDNRRELLKVKRKLEADTLGKQNEQMESLRKQLREKDARIKELEARVEASQNDEKIQQLEAILAAMRQVIEGLQKVEPDQQGAHVEEEET